MKKKLLEQIGSQLIAECSFVSTSFPSVFSKEDVLKLLDNYTESIFAIVSGMEEKVEAATELSVENRMMLEGNLREAIERKLDRMDSSDVVDYDSAEFDIEYGNTLRLESVNLNTGNICDEIDNAISDVIGDFFSPAEEEVNIKEPEVN